MKHIEVLNVEFGECTALVGNKGQILMVDCGSINNKLRSPSMDMSQVFDFIKDRYKNASSRSFLLTHYHRDHFCGFRQIIKNTPDYFHKIYLPYIPRHLGSISPILEMAIISSLLISQNRNLARVNTSFLKIFETLNIKENFKDIEFLKAEDRFVFDDRTYTVLSPKKEDFSYSDKFLHIANTIRSLCSCEFNEIKDRFISNYYYCMDNIRNVSLVTQGIKRLEMSYESLMNCDIGDEAFKICEIIENMSTLELYSLEMNRISLVFHNTLATGSMDILMTGDMPDSNGFYQNLREGYNIVKAPHHGTDSYFWDDFSTMAIEHMIISSGDYKDGKISQRYVSLPFMCHCTNQIGCSYYIENGFCCNKLKFCQDIFDLGLKCRSDRCNIYVLSPNKARGCL